MALDQSQAPTLEIAHVLFMDIVAYSRLPMDQQRRVLRQFQQLVSSTPAFIRAKTKNELITLPTGDGMALVFFGDAEAPARCALELCRALQSSPELQLRMGLHTGPVYRVEDINANRNVAGGGINVAQRVMDSGDAGHILLSSSVAEVLGQLSTWADALHDLGEVEVKHGLRLHLFNFCKGEFGNPERPLKLRSGTPLAGRGEIESPQWDVLQPQPLGQTVSHYHILKVLGGGGMGVVYEAEDTRLDRHVALKFLPSELCSDARAVERFQREARATSALNHPHICTVHDIGVWEGQHYIVMELLEGATLKNFIDGRPLGTPQILKWGTQIAEALEAAHAKGIIHRDIKPSNIFITERGDAKVLDFGLAKLPAKLTPSSSESEELTLTGLPLGTLAYMAPEQLRGEPADSRSDIYAAGLVLYEMVTGRRLFSEIYGPPLINAILNRTPPPPRTQNPQISPALEAVILKALEKNSERRQQSAGELRADLERSGRPAGGKQIRRLLTSRVAVLAGAGLLVGVMIAGLTVGGWRKRLFGEKTPAQVQRSTPSPQQPQPAPKPSNARPEPAAIQAPIQERTPPREKEQVAQKPMPPIQSALAKPAPVQKDAGTQKREEAARQQSPAPVRSPTSSRPAPPHTETSPPVQAPAQQAFKPPAQAAPAVTPGPNAGAEEAAYKALYELRSAPQQQIQFGEDFLKKYPDSRYRESVYSKLCTAYMSAGQEDKMFAAGEKALELNPNDVDVLALLALTTPRRVNTKSPDANDKLARSENYAKRGIGLLQSMEKRVGINEQDFTRAKREKLSMCHSGLGMVYFQRGKYSDSIAELEQAVRLAATPDPVDFYVLGMAYQNGKRYPDAVTAFGHCTESAGPMQARCQQNLDLVKKLAADDRPSLIKR